MMGWEPRAESGDGNGSWKHLEGMSGSMQSEESELQSLQGSRITTSPCSSSGAGPSARMVTSAGLPGNRAPFKVNSKLCRQGLRVPHHVPLTAMTHTPHAQNLLPGALQKHSQVPGRPGRGPSSEHSSAACVSGQDTLDTALQ